MRQRLFLLLVAPLVALLVIGAQATGHARDARQSTEAALVVADLALEVAAIDAALGNETVVAISSRDGLAEVGPASLTLAQSRTDLAVSELQRKLGDMDDPLNKPIGEALQAIEASSDYRDDLAQGFVTPLQLVDRNGHLRGALLEALTWRAAAERGGTFSSELLGLVALIEARGAHVDERVVLDLALRYGRWAPGQHTAVVVATSDQFDLIERAVLLAGSEPPTAVGILTETRHDVVNSDGDIPSLTRGAWRSLSNSWLQQLDQEVARTAERLSRTIEDRNSAASAQQRYVLGGVSLAILLAIFTAAILGAQLVGRVRRIASAAAALSLEHTPTAEIDDRGSDEIAEMAEAFDRMTKRIRDASSVRSIESNVLTSIANDRPLNDTINLCGQLLPPGYRFGIEESRVFISNTDGVRQSLDDASMSDTVHDEHLALSLARMAEWRAANIQILMKRATTDALTLILNRSASLRKLDEVCELGEPSILYLDVDHFKRLNDTHGHETGDKALREIAVELSEVAASVSGFAGRIGGDEFILVVPDALDDTELTRLGEELIESAGGLQGRASVGLSLSVGIASKRSGQSAEQLLHEADAAMYEAKSQGRRQVVVADDRIRDQIKAMTEIEVGLGPALRHDDFTVAFQGIWDATGKRLVALEALARWTDRQGRPQSPAVFFAAAERIGRAPEIDQLIMTKVCAQIYEWTRDGFVVPPVHVNMSAQTVNQPSMVANVLRTVREARVAPSAILVEVTESAFIDEIEAASDRLDRLRAEGIRIAVDDFGEGYSSLRYLSKLPIDVLKIDRQYIDHVDSNTNNRAIVRAVTDLARSLGMEVVAEGVERPEEHRVLVELGCTQLQGFLFGRPEPAAATSASLGSGHLRTNPSLNSRSTVG